MLSSLTQLESAYGPALTPTRQQFKTTPNSIPCNLVFPWCFHRNWNGSWSTSQHSRKILELVLWKVVKFICGMAMRSFGDLKKKINKLLMMQSQKGGRNFLVTSSSVCLASWRWFHEFTCIFRSGLLTFHSINWLADKTTSKERSYSWECC